LNESIKLVSIPEEQYSTYKYEAIFQAYKWDPQVEDHNTVSRHALLLNPETANQLKNWAEALSLETMRMEEALIKRPDLWKELSLPRKVAKALHRSYDYRQEDHVRLMRFDFHPTENGWAVSEVNSDVPGGLAEASVLPEIAEKYLENCTPRYHIGQCLYEAFREKLPKNSTVAFVHATSYSDDRQVMQFLSDYFEQKGVRTVFAGPDHLQWKQRQAYSILDGADGIVEGIVRFFPLEWLENLPRKSKWRGYYDCAALSCNHPAAIVTQSKRLPLIWEKTGISIPVWKTLLPETRDPRAIDSNSHDWILKPALGRVGEGISIEEAITEKELKNIKKAVRRHPDMWVAQKKFESRPLITDGEETYHLCLGVFTVNGRCAGFYGRISPFARIDDRAKDIPVLIMKERKEYAG